MFKNIMWATDGSEHADRALDYATRLAKSEGAVLHVAYVVETIVGGRVAGQVANLNEDEIKAKIEAHVATLVGEQGLDARLHIARGQTGKIATRILEIARGADADLIVVGTHGHSALGTVLLGSVTQRLLHVGHCPVLAVPPVERVTADDGAGTLIAAG
jgi:nucleotide-binding universal stress UspA family protein